MLICSFLLIFLCSAKPSTRTPSIPSAGQSAESPTWQEGGKRRKPKCSEEHGQSQDSAPHLQKRRPRLEGQEKHHAEEETEVTERPPQTGKGETEEPREAPSNQRMRQPHGRWLSSKLALWLSSQEDFRAGPSPVWGDTYLCLHELPPATLKHMHIKTCVMQQHTFCLLVLSSPTSPRRNRLVHSVDVGDGKEGGFLEVTRHDEISPPTVWPQ